MIYFHVITLFPESIEPYLNSSIVKRAQERILKRGSKPGRKPLIKIAYYNPRDFTLDPQRRVDRAPYGGGPGMVLEAESLLRAVHKAVGTKKGVEVVFFSPSGEQFTNVMAQQYAQPSSPRLRRAKHTHIVFICGRYEGVDARVPHILKAKHVSVGPYVLTGGELPAAIMIDAIVRHVPGVLGNEDSIEEKRSACPAPDGAGASPDVYTRPEVLVWKGKKYTVPSVLLSGDHKKIEEWRRGQLEKGI